MLEEFEPYGRWVVVRNPDWWAESEDQHNIIRIVHAWNDDADNLAALLNGEIDLLQVPLYSGIEQIRPNRDLKLVHRPN